MSKPTAISTEAEVATSTNTVVPQPCTITPALLKTHNITDEEYAKILATLGRTPSLTELGIYSVMWSEHCSYKSSRVHLKRLPTKGTRLTGPGSVMQGPGENAGIIDVGDGWACAFKIESHNHPSYIEPYQGAATGVGGILRDIFTMGARPMAVMDSLRFGPFSPATEPGAPSSPQARVGSANNDITDYARNRSIMEGVVHGVAGYGNCFGVPNLGGETRFEPCYSGNPLLNAFALGLVRHDEIFYAKATGIGNPVIYVGAKTGRDGIHGATMASEEFTEGSEQKRPNVQMGDPFLEKLLLEACLEAMKSGAVAGIQDMGAAGLTCSICEMGARGEVGLDVELNLVPQRDTGMSSYEIMLSESQERMLLVAHGGREHEVLAIFDKWGLDAAVVGTVIAENRMKIRHNGELVADLSNTSLTDDAPLYHRPVGTWTPTIDGEPVPLDPQAWVLDELKKPRDYTADLLQLLASPNICSKAHIYEQYDSMVQTNTVFGPGQAEAGVIRIKGTGTSTATELGAPSSPQAGVGSAVTKPERGLAMALAGNGRWTFLDPKLGAMHAVAEAARKVACTGATPVAATNCLNFGNPMKPEIMAQLSLAIDGISEACTALGTPITGGNVSLYNETKLGGKAEGIYPTPVIGIVGILDDVTKAVPNAFQRAGDKILLLKSTGDKQLANLGSSEFAKTCVGATWGTVPSLNVEAESHLNRELQALATRRLIRSAMDISDGGLAAAIAKAALSSNLGASIDCTHMSDEGLTSSLFGEYSANVIVTCHPHCYADICQLLDEEGDFRLVDLGEVTTKADVQIKVGEDIVIDCDLRELRESFSTTLEEKLAGEVVLA